MSRVLVEELSLEHIADAIREKNGEETTYKPAEMADAILGIETYPEPTGTKSITANGSNIDVKDYAKADVNVPNSYSQSDEGKVVSNGSLKVQTSKNINANGTVDTTENNSVVVAVPNTYTASDEGKVVDNGALVSQTSQSVTENGTYDTTLKNEVVVNVSGGGGGSANGFPVVEKHVEDMKRGYVSSGTFFYDETDSTRCDVWKVKSGRKYAIILGDTVGNRFRAMFSASNPTATTSNITGVQIGYDLNSDSGFINPNTIKGKQETGLSAYSNGNMHPYEAPSDGYIIVGKTNQDVTGIPCYLVDVTNPPSEGGGGEADLIADILVVPNPIPQFPSVEYGTVDYITEVQE